MDRPVNVTCQGCGDPAVPVGEKGAIPTFCVGCAGWPRNPKHKGWSGKKLQAVRLERRRQRIADGEPVPDELVAELPEFKTDEPDEQWSGYMEDEDDEEETHDHADVVADDQVAAQAYWGGGDLQPPDGPVQLNTPVYDPDADPLVVGSDGLGPGEEAHASEDLVAPFEPEVVGGPALDEGADYPDSVDVCVAPGCALPDPGHGHDLFCRNHWRLISLETRQRVIGAPAGPARNSAVHRALFEIRRATGV